MGVDENVFDEIYNERAQYLVNIDDMMYEMYVNQFSIREPVLGTKPLSIPVILNWSIRSKSLTRFFARKEYQKNIQLTPP